MIASSKGKALSAGEGWWMVGMLLVFSTLSVTDRFVLAMVLDNVKGGLHLSDFQMGVLLGPAVAISYAASALMFGWMADRYSRRSVIFIGIISWSLATAACGLAHSFASLFVARAFVGLGEAALLPSAYSLINDGIRPARVTTAFSIFAGGNRWGQAAAFARGGWILGYFTWLLNRGVNLGGLVPWQLTFVFLGGVGMALALLVFTFPEPVRRDPPLAVDRASPKSLLAFSRKNAGLLVLLIVSCTVMTMVSNAIYNWSPAFVGRAFGWKPAAYGPVIGLLSIVAATALIGHGRIADILLNRRGMQDVHIRYYTWVLGAAIPLGIGMFFIPNPIVFLATLCLFEILALPFTMFVLATVARIAPKEFRAQLTACFVFCQSIAGMAASPLLVGALTDYVFKDPAKLGWSLAVVASVGCACAFVLLRIALRPLNSLLQTDSANVVPAMLQPKLA